VAGGSSVAKSKFYSGRDVLSRRARSTPSLRMAAAGAELHLLRSARAIRAARTWRAPASSPPTGLVRTHHRRRAGGGWQYYVVRTGKGLITRLDPVAAALADPATDLIFRALKRAANMGFPCPSDADLARTCGLNTRDQAQHRVRKLIDLGLVQSTLAYDGGVPFRVVTIAETAKCTALPRKWAALQAAAERETRQAGGAS
jgi:hypothetical protein